MGAVERRSWDGPAGGGVPGATVGHVSSEDVLGVLEYLNPWWRGREARVPPFSRPHVRAVASHLASDDGERILVLTGPRGVGKTAVLRQAARAVLPGRPDGRHLCYMDFDHPVLRGSSPRDLLRIYHEHVYPDGQPVRLLLDEVQYGAGGAALMGWLAELPVTYRVAAASSMRAASPGGAAGAGRELDVGPASFYEFLRLLAVDVSDLPGDLRVGDLFSMEDHGLEMLGACFRVVAPRFQQYLATGGFPGVAGIEAADERHAALRGAVIDRCIRQDAAALEGVRGVGRLERLFVYVCARSGSIFSPTECARALGTTRVTASSHLRTLERTGLVRLVAPLGRPGRRCRRGPPRVHVADPALRDAVLTVHGAGVVNGGRALSAVEEVMLPHLSAACDGDTAQVAYWCGARRDRMLSFVVGHDGQFVPFEVRYGADVPRHATPALSEFCREWGPERAVRIVRREQDMARLSVAGSGAVLLCVPAHVLAYLLGREAFVRATEATEVGADGRAATTA
jgi:predicted AAA+ superfamily ATPase